MNAVQLIPIEDLRRRADVRPVNLDAVTALAASIEAVGLMSPLRVRPMRFIDRDSGQEKFTLK